MARHPEDPVGPCHLLAHCLPEAPGGQWLQKGSAGESLRCCQRWSRHCARESGEAPGDGGLSAHTWGRVAGAGGVRRPGTWGCRAEGQPERTGDEQGRGHHSGVRPRTLLLPAPPRLPSTRPACPQSLDQGCGPGAPQFPQPQAGLRVPRDGALGPGGRGGSLHPAPSPTMSWAWPFWKEPPESPLPSSWRSTTRHFTASWTWGTEHRRWVTPLPTRAALAVVQGWGQAGPPRPSSSFRSLCAPTVRTPQLGAPGPRAGAAGPRRAEEGCPVSRLPWATTASPSQTVWPCQGPGPHSPGQRPPGLPQVPCVGPRVCVRTSRTRRPRSPVRNPCQRFLPRGPSLHPAAAVSWQPGLRAWSARGRLGRTPDAPAIRRRGCRETPGTSCSGARTKPTRALPVTT